MPRSGGGPPSLPRDSEGGAPPPPPPFPNDGSTWPALHGDLLRSGFYPRFPRGRLRLRRRKDLHRELVGPRAEVNVGPECAYIGTLRGRVFAWDRRTGEERWVHHAEGPVLHSPAYDGALLFVATPGRRLHALDARSGRARWVFEAGEGFWASPAVHAGKVLIGARDGVFYAVDARMGSLAWTFETEAMILQTASISEDGARVIFAGEDLYTYCLDVPTGKLLWRSHRMCVLSARDYFPVIAGGLALFAVNPVYEFHWILTRHERLLLEWAGYRDAEHTKGDPRLIPYSSKGVEREQELLIAHFRSHPFEQTFYAFRVAGGKEPWIAPIAYTGGMYNPPAPPCRDLSTGAVYVLARSAYGEWDGGGEVRSYTGVGKLDLETRRTEKVFGKRDTYAGFFGPGNFGWGEEGRRRARNAGLPYGLVNEWHGPARAIASVAGGLVSYNSGSQILCFRPES